MPGDGQSCGRGRHAALTAGVVLAVAGHAFAGEQHPRLFVTPQRVAVIRKQIAVRGPPRVSTKAADVWQVVRRVHRLASEILPHKPA